ncbi:NeuD/PglB/VioB family sugar acetyltransferase [Alteromonas stellipolaris]|jgi:UDP-N-acetylbacillosamine N-acetyltransferase|uniref:NeuD/PglB/VioB family sugar acetyltransferase n=1 Tax=Alteromonas stellipolaris TaxID=233316 RepID=UPI0026E12C77|nr:NeuD/PglB/VioB family sugar acetyltransferase [Alteromonas stellipolaris]MDO6540681.1 NeuD/PglB/VioB family sugar acetyltransferase [Alteromonas stellipolaris]MDP2537416.1 NeuD/PglB/VioB family sugar acetyltransferase [Alteromonas stellipolaris]
MSDVITLLGAGGHARSVLSLLRSIDVQVARIVDSTALADENVMGIPVVSDLAKSVESLVLSVGDNKIREAMFHQYHTRLWNKPLVHQRASIDENATAQRGSQIFSGAYVGPLCIVGENTIVNTHAIVEHESRIGCHSHIAVGAMVLGRCSLGDRCFVGAGAVIREGVRLTDGVIIGANAFVNCDIDEPGLYVGSPARKVKP